MGNIMQKNKPGAQMSPQQGGMYVPYQQQPMVQQQPMMRPQQPQFVQQPVMAQQPQFVQQPQFAPQQPQFAPQQPQFAPQQGYYQPSYPSGSSMPRYPVTSPFSLSTGQNPQSTYENDLILSNLTGWSVQDIERLRHEFFSYANHSGVIDREGFRKLYIASLLNMTWEALEHDAETAFRNFDINQTGGLDFNEYITACSRMTRELNPQHGSPPSANPSYMY